MAQKIDLWRNYEKYNFKPGLQVPVHKAKGSKAEQQRINEISRLGRLFDEASDPRLAPSTQLKKLYAVRRGYGAAGFIHLKIMTTRLIERIREQAG